MALREREIRLRYPKNVLQRVQVQCWSDCEAVQIFNKLTEGILSVNERYDDDDEEKKDEMKLFCNADVNFD